MKKLYLVSGILIGIAGLSLLIFFTNSGSSANQTAGQEGKVYQNTAWGYSLQLGAWEVFEEQNTSVSGYLALADANEPVVTKLITIRSERYEQDDMNVYLASESNLFTGLEDAQHQVAKVTIQQDQRFAGSEYAMVDQAWSGDSIERHFVILTGNALHHVVVPLDEDAGEESNSGVENLLQSMRFE